MAGLPANLPSDILLQICRLDPATGQALHLAYPRLSAYTTPEQREAWYYVTDGNGNRWIETKTACLMHNYDTPNPFIRNIDTVFQEWYRYGKMHRDNDLPASIQPYGMQEWYQNGLTHRDGDLPAIVFSDGDQLWYQHGKLHRNGDLPAQVWSDGIRKYYEHGVQYTPSALSPP